MIVKYNEDAFMDIDSIKAIHRVDDQHGAILMEGIQIKLPTEVFDRVLDAYWLFNKHLAYDFLDSKDENYMEKIKGDK